MATNRKVKPKRTTRRRKATPKLREDQAFALGQQIAELRGVVVEGFKGVHKRQDVTNGRIGKLEGRVDKLENNEAISKGRSQGRWRLWLVLSSIAGIIIGLLTIVALSGCWGLICH